MKRLEMRMNTFTTEAKNAKKEKRKKSESRQCAAERL